MEPKEEDFEFPRGDTPVITFNLTDLNGNALNLEEAEIYFTMKKNKNISNYILQKKYSTGDISVDGKKGSLFIKHTDTASLKYGKYWYDICVKFPTSTSAVYVQTLARGYITLGGESTFIENE